MSFVEHFLDKRWNPLNVLARHGMLGLGGMVNKFDQASELLDDLNDHWCANVHKKERNWLVDTLQRLALEKQWRVTFLSGDVHVAAVVRVFSSYPGVLMCVGRPFHVRQEREADATTRPGPTIHA